MQFLDRRSFLRTAAAWGAVGGGILAGAPGRVRGQQPDDFEFFGDEYVTPAAQRAIDDGLAYLAQRQNDDGSFGVGPYSRNVGLVALAGMAFLSGGNTPERGPYGRQAAEAARFVLESSQESGFLHAPDASSHGPMYEHGFGTLFLAEVYGMTPDSLVRERLVRAVQLIVDTQNADGGWRYRPQQEEGDISVTVCQTMALRAARNAGIFVPVETIDRCLDFVKRSQNPDGGFMYMLQGGPSMFPRSAAGVVALFSAGVYEGEEVEKGLAYLLANTPQGDLLGREQHYFYGLYYAAQAMWHAGGDFWKRWYPPVREALLARQLDNGSWMDPIAPEYGAAMACLILQMPNNYLPIFQR